MRRRRLDTLIPGLIAAVLGLALPSCAAEDANPPATQAAPAATADAAPAEAAAGETEVAADVDTAAPDTAAADEIDPASISQSATIEILQYQAAFIGSGTLGKGTLFWQGEPRAFRIGGLGIGGIGVAKIDATGVVYDLNRLEDFTGVYGNARLGATAADKGKGRLWLKNPSGVVIELRTKMAGLALTGGVDGIVIEWESDVQKAGDSVKDGAEGAWSGTKDGSKKAADAVKGVFK